MGGHDLPLWVISVISLAVLLLAVVYGTLARLLLRRRARLSMTASIVMAIVGMSLGFALAWLIDPTLTLHSPLAILLALAASMLAVGIYAALAAHFQRPTQASTAELMRLGESDRVEFKSSARVNMHTGKKDGQMEVVIAKTLAAFLNADGGTLLIGVDDAGTPLGLDPDMQTLRQPDNDRFELWLRDWLTATLGPNAAGLAAVSFEQLPDLQNVERTVCRVTTPASPGPVFLRPGKNTEPQLWVRSGNSTRQLPVDAAATYVANRWPLPVGRSLSAQFKATMRFAKRS